MVAMPLDDHKSCDQKGVIKRGRHLAQTTTRFIPNFVGIQNPPLNVAVLRRTLSHNLIEREDRSRYHKVPVQAFRRKAKVLLDALFLILDRCGVRGYPYQIVRITSRARKQTLNQTRHNKATEQHLIRFMTQKRSPFNRGLNPRIRATLPPLFVANSLASTPAANFWFAIPG
jgi:hypothetical protein